MNTITYYIYHYWPCLQASPSDPLYRPSLPTLLPSLMSTCSSHKITGHTYGLVKSYQLSLPSPAFPAWPSQPGLPSLAFPAWPSQPGLPGQTTPTDHTYRLCLYATLQVTPTFQI